jgi:hypothetical protein
MPDQRPDARRRLVHGLRSAFGSEQAAAAGTTGKEPCAGCGEETAAGSVFFSDRRQVTRSDGVRSFLCSDCLGRAHAARKGEALTDADLRVIADNGLMIGVGLLGGGGTV